MARVALLAGASGLTGGRLLDYLLDDAAFTRVVAVGRRPLARRHAKLEAITADFAALPALDGSDAFCCLGTTMRKAGSAAAFRAVDHDHVLAFGRAAKAGGAERFYLVSSVGADAAARTFYLRVKGETEAAVAALGFPGLDVFRPGLLIGPRAERRPVEALSQRLLPLIDPLLPSRFRTLDHDRLARAILAATQLPAAHRVHHNPEIEELAASIPLRRESGGEGGAHREAMGG